MRQFAALFRGTLTTETMLVQMLNDTIPDCEAVAEFMAELHPAMAYLAVPTRPPTESWIEPANEAVVNAAYQVFQARLPRVELLT